MHFSGSVRIQQKPVSGVCTRTRERTITAGYPVVEAVLEREQLVVANWAAPNDIASGVDGRILHQLARWKRWEKAGNGILNEFVKGTFNRVGH